MKNTFFLIAFFAVLSLTIFLQFKIPFSVQEEMKKKIYSDAEFDKISFNVDTIKLAEGFYLELFPTSYIGSLELNDCLLPGGKLCYDIALAPSLQKIRDNYQDAHIHIDDDEPIIMGYYAGKAKVKYDVDSYISKHYIELPKKKAPKGTKLLISIPVKYEIRKFTGNSSTERRSMGSRTVTHYYSVMEPMKVVNLRFSVPIGDNNLSFSNRFENESIKSISTYKKNNIIRAVLFALPMIIMILYAYIYKNAFQSLPIFALLLPLFEGICGAIFILFVLAPNILIGLILGGVTLIYYYQMDEMY